jgi:hypothetical protein
VEYSKAGWSNATNAKTALDDLHERLSSVEQGGGGSPSDDEISNADLAMLADKLLVAGGIRSGKWISGAGFSQMFSYNDPLANWQSQEITFNPNSLQSADSYGRVSFRVYAGDVLHYKGLGRSYFRPFVITDLDYKVLYAADYPNVSQNTDITDSGTYNVTHDGWVFAVVVLGGNIVSNKYIYAQWSTRKTIKGIENLVYSAFGDSISTDSSFSDQRPVTYTRILAGLIRADLDRYSVGGANIGSLIGSGALSYVRGRSDADLVTILYGANDAAQIGSATPPIGCSFPFSGTISSGSVSYQVTSQKLLDVIKTSGVGIVINGHAVKVTKISVLSDQIETDLYTNNDGYALTSDSRYYTGNSAFISTGQNVDFSSLALNDTIKIYFIDDSENKTGGTTTISFGAKYHVGTSEFVTSVQNIVDDKIALASSFIGRYRIALESILERAPKAKVVAISPIGMNALASVLESMRTELSALVTAKNSNRLFYANGKSMLDYNSYYYLTGDATHPNMIGEYVIAHNLYDKCVKDALGL